MRECPKSDTKPPKNENVKKLCLKNENSYPVFGGSSQEVVV